MGEGTTMGDLTEVLAGIEREFGVTLAELTEDQRKHWIEIANDMLWLRDLERSGQRERALRLGKHLHAQKIALMAGVLGIAGNTAWSVMVKLAETLVTIGVKALFEALAGELQT